MGYCTECGVELAADDTKFCTECGAPVPKARAKNRPDALIPKARPSPPRPPGRSKPARSATKSAGARPGGETRSFSRARAQSSVKSSAKTMPEKNMGGAERPKRASSRPASGRHYCTHCGAELAPDGAKFCHQCGTPALKPSAANASDPWVSTNKPQSPQPPWKNRLRRWLPWSALGLVVIAAVVVGLYFGLRGDESGIAVATTETDPETSTTLATAAPITSSTEIAFDDAALFPVDVDGYYGYIDRTGEIVIQPQFWTALPFSEDLALVQLGDEYWGYIDESGQMVIQPQFPEAGDFSDGLAIVGLEQNGTDGYSDGWIGPSGYIDKSGQVVIEAKFPQACDFSEGLAMVALAWDGPYGYIDHSGQMVIQPQFEQAESFSEGLALVKLDWEEPYGYINQSGQMVIQPQFFHADSFSEGLALVALEQDGPWGFIDQDGVMVIQPQFYRAADFSEGLARVELERDGPYGYIDRSGQMVIQPQFYGAGDFSEGLAAVKLQEQSLLGYIDKSGRIIIQPQFDQALEFSEGLAMVFLPGDHKYWEGDTWGYVDTGGNLVWPREDNETDISDQTTVVEGEPITKAEIKALVAPETDFTPAQITVVDYKSLGNYAAAHIRVGSGGDTALALFKREGSEWTLLDLGTGLSRSELGPDAPAELVEWAFH